MIDNMKENKIRVKFLSRINQGEWRRYFPDESLTWGCCQFVFDRLEKNYDWLVVYDDVPPVDGQPSRLAVEHLACPADKTLLVTTEPESIKSYGSDFARQFGAVLTSQPYWALPHKKRYWQQAANHWFYGSGRDCMSRERLLSGGSEKKKNVSMVGSRKAEWHTAHYARYRFMRELSALMPEIEVFGRGFKAMDDKAEALDDFRYHVCIENHISPHHWTEKLSDAFLGRCLPFYAGATNLSEYFPAESFVSIDINDPAGAADMIRRAIEEDWYAQRISYIEQAREKVINEYHLFAVIEKIVKDNVRPGSGALTEIYSRHALRSRSIRVAVFQAIEKIYVRVRSVISRIGGKK